MHETLSDGPRPLIENGTHKWSLMESKRPRKRSSLQRRSPGVHPTSEDKAKYVDLFTREFAAGHSVKAIASKYHVSTASVYRWWRQSNTIHNDLSAKTATEHLQIENAIDVLCNPSQVSPIAVRNALFQFLIWMRWPSEQELHVPALINCTANYLRQRYGIVQVSSLEAEEASSLSRYLTLDVAARLTSLHAPLNPSFDIVTSGTGRVDDRQFYAKVVNYLLSVSNASASKNHTPNLTSLKILVQAGAFDRKWLMSSRTFDNHWRSRSRTFPFLYVEQYHSNCDWSLNPEDDSFSEDVDALLQERQELREYFAKVKWVIQKLSSVLDKRAVSHIRFTELPAWVEAIPVSHPALDDQLRAKIAAHL